MVLVQLVVLKVVQQGLALADSELVVMVLPVEVLLQVNHSQLVRPLVMVVLLLAEKHHHLGALLLV